MQFIENLRLALTSLVANNCSIVEMTMAKLDLEQVFLRLTAQSEKKSSLQELLDETPDTSGDADTDDMPDNPYDAAE